MEGNALQFAISLLYEVNTFSSYDFRVSLFMKIFPKFFLIDVVGKSRGACATKYALRL